MNEKIFPWLKGFCLIPRATLGDFWALLPPALPLPEPVIGVLTLMVVVTDFQVALDHSKAGTEMARDGKRRSGQTTEATASVARSCISALYHLWPRLWQSLVMA